MSSGASVAALFTETHDASTVARIDPRLRLVAALAFALAVPLLTSAMALVLALATALLAVVWARLSLRSVWRRIAMAEAFLVVLLVSLPFAIPGTPWLSVLGFTASLEGLQRAIVLVLRINAALLVVLALVGGLGGQRLAAAMVGIGVPPRLAALLQMTMRYVATFGDEYRRLRTAMRVRGFRARSNLHSWRSLGNLVGMLLVRSLERAERVRWAMLCRGYAGRFPLVPAGPLGRSDGLFAIAAIAILLTLLALEAWR